MDNRIAKLGVFFATIMAVLLLAAPSMAVAEEQSPDGQKYYLGEAVNAGKDTGYSETNSIGKDDIHYSWELGRFFISDYTRVTDDNGTPVFLKNVGDEVTFSFNLQQDINRLNGNSDVTIDTDSNGYDQRLGIPQQNFGRGTLIIRYTDYQNNRHEPLVYTNYLEGVSQGADTVAKTFEEGDYEVALDYSIKNVNHGRLPWVNVEIFPGVTDYTMRFIFKVRNGNCMVYPFDVKTNDELTNTAFTENGFRLDLARSRYLDIDVKKEVLADNGDELVADTRFNKPARDGEEFTDEGVYTFTVTNRYTGRETTKMIYVGSDPVLKAHATTGKSVSEINTMLADGATVGDDGTIIKEGQTVAEPLPPDDNNEVAIPAQNNDSELSIIAASIAFAAIIVLALVFMMRGRSKKKASDSSNEPTSEA
ncbi:hypothetical protein GMI69_06060 [Eggerthellaceae bacterium zg-887]|uniref:hypothetical protein n=1 Tax=Xiamenia xianingshaonis TaxID=2682776 RepID=UPI00140AB21E|nr:hypothetical protein [Xiamenia xianingshaonis]NHM16221.1 hypothetical protein [Xiamenia xianingshaonis]